MHGWPFAGLSLGHRRRALKDEAGAAVQLLVRAHRGHAERQRPGACRGRGWEQQLLQLGPADACSITNPARLPSIVKPVYRIDGEPTVLQYLQAVNPADFKHELDELWNSGCERPRWACARLQT